MNRLFLIGIVVTILSALNYGCGQSTETRFRNALCKDSSSTMCSCVWALSFANYDNTVGWNKFIQDYTNAKQKGESTRNAAIGQIAKGEFSDISANSSYIKAINSCTAAQENIEQLNLTK